MTVDPPFPDLDKFITRNLRLRPTPGVPEIQLYAAHPASGLGRLARDDHDPPPYWSYLWAGGVALARYVSENPRVVAGRRILDLGTGGGIVAIAAAKAGAASVLAIDIDPNALVAARLNAAANGVSIDLALAELSAAPARIDLVLAGDVFYADDLAGKSSAFLRLCRRAGLDVLVGDPGRKFLPRAMLRPITEYPVADFGVAESVSGHVFALDS